MVPARDRAAEDLAHQRGRQQQILPAGRPLYSELMNTTLHAPHHHSTLTLLVSSSPFLLHRLIDFFGSLRFFSEWATQDHDAAFSSLEMDRIPSQRQLAQWR